ncbi:MAG: Uma2 family endonuclease [Armatimonadetes bacterium]|nr:Uma2 family endonuclease [Anaerolineae bacterium]
MFGRKHTLPCHTSGEAGAYKRTPMSEGYPDPVPPLWAVEIISPTDKARNIRAKRNLYRGAGILLWEIYPQDASVDVYAPDGSERIAVGLDGVLDGGDVLPGFTLTVQALFGI